MGSLTDKGLQKRGATPGPCPAWRHFGLAPIEKAGPEALVARNSTILDLGHAAHIGNFLVLDSDGDPNGAPVRLMPDWGTGEMSSTVFEPRKWREVLMFLVLSVAIWPVVATVFVGAYGFSFWMYFVFFGPPGPR